MPWNDTAMQEAANTLRSKYVHAQLHHAAAGVNGTANVSTAGRNPVVWEAVTANGDFDLDAPLAFTGGESSGPVYSVTLWDAPANGAFGGEFLINAGDTSFNADGEFTLDHITHNGQAS